MATLFGKKRVARFITKARGDASLWLPGNPRVTANKRYESENPA